jgi:uncharacterized protein YpiB (UPF0302 family)
MNEKSQTELMQLSTTSNNQVKENFIQNLYIDALLVEIQLKAEKEKLARKIDEALDQRDKSTFLQLSRQMNELNKKFGT